MNARQQRAKWQRNIENRQRKFKFKLGIMLCCALSVAALFALGISPSSWLRSFLIEHLHLKLETLPKKAVQTEQPVATQEEKQDPVDAPRHPTAHGQVHAPTELGSSMPQTQKEHQSSVENIRKRERGFREWYKPPPGCNHPDAAWRVVVDCNNEWIRKRKEFEDIWRKRAD